MYFCTKVKINMLRDQAADFINELGYKRVPFIFIIDFEMLDSRVIPLSELSSDQILYCVQNAENSKKPDLNKTKDFSFSVINPVPFSVYEEACSYCIDELKKGNSYLLNLTFPTEIECSLSLEEIFYLSNAPYKLLVRDEFVCFSPETFIKIIDGKIFSYPMKGTIDASVDHAKEILLSDEKEMAEHYTIVDLIRNDLGMVSEKIMVNKFRYVDVIETNRKKLLQVSSQISGELPQNFYESLGDIIFRLLPAGSISGAPKHKTLEIIRNAEKQPRGYYTGIFGVFDGINLDSAVMIRFIEKRNQRLIYRSGGGITTRSVILKEYHELLNKVYLPFTRL